MALQLHPNKISLSDIATEFGGSGTLSMSQFYAGKGLVPSVAVGFPFHVPTPIPTAGPISLGNFHGSRKEFIIEFTSSTMWTVPADVKRAKLLVVAGGGGGGFGIGGTNVGGGGGGGGGVTFIEEVNLTPGQQIPIIVGAGGAPSKGIETIYSNEQLFRCYNNGWCQLFGCGTWTLYERHKHSKHCNSLYIWGISPSQFIRLYHPGVVNYQGAGGGGDPLFYYAGSVSVVDHRSRGSNSSFGGYSASGGGCGGSYGDNVGLNGGNGGGASGVSVTTSGSPGVGGQGNTGGTAYANSYSGGGGGSGAPGTTGGGGAARVFQFIDKTYHVGGGGGPGHVNNPNLAYPGVNAGVGGLNSRVPGDGIINTGGGGGGGYLNQQGGRGGSGIVVLYVVN